MKPKVEFRSNKITDTERVFVDKQLVGYTNPWEFNGVIFRALPGKYLKTLEILDEKRFKNHTELARMISRLIEKH